MADPFLEARVRDLVATAKQETSNGSPEAARHAYQTALAAVGDALALDPANQTALRLQSEVLDTLRGMSSASTKPAPAPASVLSRPVEAPRFELIAEGDTPPIFERVNWLASDRGGYLPSEEMLSVLDSTPKPEKKDYWAILGAILALGFLVIAVRVISYYASPHRALDAATLEARAHMVPLHPMTDPGPAAGPVDETIYFPGPGVTLPVLRSKSEPRADSGGKVVLLALIDVTGKPVIAKITRGLDSDRNAAAMEAAEKWRFRPGTKDGKPVPVMAQLEVNFRQQ